MPDGIYRLKLNAETFAYLRLYDDGRAQYCRGSADESAGWLNHDNARAITGTYEIVDNSITIELKNPVTELTVTGKGVVKDGGLNLVLTWDELGQREGGRFESINWTASMAKAARDCAQKAAAMTTEDKQREANNNQRTREFSRNLLKRQIAIRETLAPHQKQLAEAFAQVKRQKMNYLLAAVLDGGAGSDNTPNTRCLIIIHNERLSAIQLRILAC